tara:strand:- start:3856 stop:4554 length:699 start_codon:yes stop_codon:yes gene_type:complete
MDEKIRRVLEQARDALVGVTPAGMKMYARDAITALLEYDTPHCDFCNGKGEVEDLPFDYEDNDDAMIMLPCPQCKSGTPVLKGTEPDSPAKPDDINQQMMKMSLEARRWVMSLSAAMSVPHPDTVRSDGNWDRAIARADVGSRSDSTDDAVDSLREQTKQLLEDRFEISELYSGNIVDTILALPCHNRTVGECLEMYPRVLQQGKEWRDRAEKAEAEVKRLAWIVQNTVWQF